MENQQYEVITYNHAQLDDHGYCIGLSSVTGEIESADMVLIEAYDASYLGRKYDLVANVWTNEYLTAEPNDPPVNDVNELIRETHKTTMIVADDNMINMDMILELDMKLTALLDHLGIEY